MQYVSTSKDLKEWRCKDGNITNDLKSANVVQIDTVSPMNKPEPDKMSQLEGCKNVDYTRANQLELDWTEEVKFNEN